MYKNFKRKSSRHTNNKMRNNISVFYFNEYALNVDKLNMKL